MTHEYYANQMINSGWVIPCDSQIHNPLLNVSSRFKTIKVHADLVSGLIPESALKSIEGIYERFVDLKAVDNSHGLS